MFAGKLKFVALAALGFFAWKYFQGKKTAVAPFYGPGF